MEKLVKDIYCETYEFWKKNKDRYKNSDKGFAVFYSPVKINPKLMIIGLNPGWKKGDEFNEKKACEIPEKHDYVAYEGQMDDYDLAIIQRDFFKQMDLTEELQNSVKLNLIFFRTSDTTELKSLNIYKELKAFSKDKVKLIIDTIRPRIILTEGIGVFDELIGMFGATDQETLISDVKGRILDSAKIGNSLIVGMIHPSGKFTKNRFQIHRDEIAGKVKKSILA